MGGSIDPVALLCTLPLPHDFIYMYVHMFCVVRTKTGQFSSCVFYL